MQPPRTLAFVVSVLAMLFLVSLFFPKEGIRVNENYTLQFLTLNEIFSSDSMDYADISEILDNSQAISDSAFLAMVSIPAGEEAVFDTLRANADSLKMRIYPIEYPGGDSTLLYPFFHKIRGLKRTGNSLRILHYGDSQIEGDRITSYIRFKLQEQFGGSGIGLQPPASLYGYQLSIRHTASDNWDRYTAFGKVDSTITHNRYGALGCFTRFTPYPEDLSRDPEMREAWITLKQSQRSYSLTRKFSKSRLYYGDVTQPVFIEVYCDGELFDADFLEMSEGFGIKTWNLEKAPEELNFRFKTTCSPDFYGISLDDNNGLSVDNIPLRGSSGLEFSKMNEKLLKQMYDSLNVKMILLQFGGNVVPYISSKSSYYEKWFYRELSRLKSIAPDVSIIVIGVADMSVKEKDRFHTYPSLEHVRDALRSAAFKADCAFWDMYLAMGGKNSMPSWVYANPALANADFIHFNERGARVLAEMFYNALMHDYNQYIGK